METKWKKMVFFVVVAGFMRIFRLHNNGIHQNWNVCWNIFSSLDFLFSCSGVGRTVGHVHTNICKLPFSSLLMSNEWKNENTYSNSNQKSWQEKKAKSHIVVGRLWNKFIFAIWIYILSLLLLISCASVCVHTGTLANRHVRGSTYQHTVAKVDGKKNYYALNAIIILHTWIDVTLPCHD